MVAEPIAEREVKPAGGMAGVPAGSRQERQVQEAGRQA